MHYYIILYILYLYQVLHKRRKPGTCKGSIKKAAVLKLEGEMKTTPPSDETVFEPVKKTPRMEGASSSLGSIFNEILEESSTAAGPSE